MLSRFGERLRAARLSAGPDTILLALAAVGVGAVAVWLATGWASSDTQGEVTAFASPAVDLLAALLVARAARTFATTRVRLAWNLISVGMVVYAIGDASFAWISYVQHADPFPSVADVTYVAFYPIVAAALLLFPYPAQARRDAIRLAIDATIVVVGGGMVVWHSILLPTLATDGSTPISSALSLGYPLGDLVLLLGVATLALRGPTGITRRALGALVGGLTLMFIADVAFGELTLANAPVEHWVDLLYLGSALSIGFAGYLQARVGGTPAHGETRGLGRSVVTLPYVGLVAGFGVLLGAASGTVSTAVSNLLVGAVVLTVLVLLRLELTNRENARLLAETVHRASEARYESLQGQASDAVLLTDDAGVIAYVSSSAERVLGLDGAAVIGKRVTSLAHANNADELEQLISDTAAGRPVKPLEWSLWGRDGVWRRVETVSANMLDDPTVGRIVLTTRDVRERKAFTQQLTEVAFHDLLTALPNRALFVDRVNQALSSAQRLAEPTSILKLDIDGFTRINDTLGHAVGDLILQEVGRRLTGAIRAADTVARVAGDEFAVLLDGGASAADAMDAAQRIRAAVREPLTFGGSALELTLGIGIATNEPGAEPTDAATLTRNANVAMSLAREHGLDQLVVFAPAMQERLEASFALESDLRRAISGHELVLFYQPICDLATREVVGAEALVRWNHPTRGRLSPDLFIPLAEESGLISEIGIWVLRTACVEVAKWARRAPNHVPRVSVNLASAQVADPNLPWVVQSALALAGAAPTWLTLELTERQLVLDTAEVLDRLHAISALGVKISIDDFGTGYSSLAYLQQFPVDHIKIDRSFVTPLDDPIKSSGLAGAIVEIGRALGMSTIAEGIETERQLERLVAMGCPLGQGYLLGRPLDAATMLQLVIDASSPTTSAA